MRKEIFSRNDDGAGLCHQKNKKSHGCDFPCNMKK